MSASSIGSWISAALHRPSRVVVPQHWIAGLVLVMAAGLVTSEGFLSVGAGQSLHDTYYVVSYMHYALSVGAVFAFFAAWYYLLPKLTGRLYSEALGSLHFWLTFVGVVLTFLPVPVLLLTIGPPRRLVDQPDVFVVVNWLASAGSYLSAAGLIAFAAAMFHTWLRGRHG